MSSYSKSVPEELESSEMGTFEFETCRMYFMERVNGEPKINMKMIKNTAQNYNQSSKLS